MWEKTSNLDIYARLSVRTEQAGSHSTDFDEVWYLSIFRKAVEKVEFLYYLKKITSTLLEDVRAFVKYR